VDAVDGVIGDAFKHVAQVEFRITACSRGIIVGVRYCRQFGVLVLLFLKSKCPVVFAGCYPNNLVVHTDTLFDEKTETLFLSSKPDLIADIIVVEAFILNGWFKYRSSLKPGGVPKEGQPVETACVGLPYQLIAICDFRRDLSLMFHCVSQGDPAYLGLAGASDVYVVAVKNADFTPCNEC